MKYEANWKSLDKRPVPAWFDDAKFGIFIHWGLYSVPAWAPKKEYSEWYGSDYKRDHKPTKDFHKRTYGEDFKYEDFVNSFTAELFDEKAWVNLFKRSGAKYLALTSRHHDGYCLWSSQYSYKWNSVDLVPHKNIVGKLTEEAKKQGIKMGLYYSLLEWDHPLYDSNPEEYALKHMIPQMKELIEAYEPSLLFTDGEWGHPSETWHSCEFLQWLFNESSVKDEIVVNDRWGKETRSSHGGYFTTEYGEVGAGKQLVDGQKWEENRGVGSSFGFNRIETLEDYLSEKDIIHMLVEIVCKGGNLLLNVGPTSDGRIPVIQEERLLQMGKWLEVNGEGIYGTKKYKKTSQDENTYFVQKENNVYVHCLKWPKDHLVLDMELSNIQGVTILGVEGQLNYDIDDGNVTIEVPNLTVDEIPCNHAYVIKLAGIE